MDGADVDRFGRSSSAVLVVGAKGKKQILRFAQDDPICLDRVSTVTSVQKRA